MWETVYISAHQSFRTSVISNMCNVTFEVPKLCTFVFKKCSDKIYLHD